MNEWTNEWQISFSPWLMGRIRYYREVRMVVSKCFIFLLIVQQSLNHVLTFFLPCPPYHTATPWLSWAGSLFALPGGLQPWCNAVGPEIPPSIYELPQPARGWCHSHSAGPGPPPASRAQRCPGMSSSRWQKEFPSSSQQAVRRGFPETCPWRCSDKENITCALAGCNHGWAGWRRIGVSQCLDNCDLGTGLKYFNYKPLHNVRWPTWKLSRACRQVCSLFFVAAASGVKTILHWWEWAPWPGRHVWGARRDSLFSCYLWGLKAPLLGWFLCKSTGGCLPELVIHMGIRDFPIRLSFVCWILDVYLIPRRWIKVVWFNGFSLKKL